MNTNNFEFYKLKEDEVLIISNLAPSNEWPRLLWLTHPEKPMNESMKAYLAYKFSTSDNYIINELIQKFNSVITNKAVKKLNVLSTFTIRGERYWIADGGRVLCTNTWPTGANIWAQLRAGKLPYGVETINLLYASLAVPGWSRDYKKFVREWNKLQNPEVK